MFAKFIAPLLLITLTLSCTRNQAPPPPADPDLPTLTKREVSVPTLPFSNVAAEAGVDYQHYNGAVGDKMLPETMGGGVAWFDYDGDGDQDLLFVSGADWPETPTERKASSLTLYQNDGTGAFTDVTTSVGLTDVFYGIGVAIADVDGDDREDIFITNVGENKLYMNRENGFEDVTAAAGVAGEADGWSSGAAFFDYDRDGDLDLFVCNYVRWSRDIDIAVDFRLTGVGRAYGPPTNFEGAHPYLYRNEGDGSFTDVSAESGVQVLNPATDKPMAKALAVIPIDHDEDGFLDLIIANDTVQNFFFRNQGDGTFAEIGADVGLAFDRNGAATGAMGIDAAFYRNDAQLGIAIGNFANEMTSLYVTQPAIQQFADEAIGEGVGPASRLALTFGLLFFDVDLDGRVDMVQTNGHLEEEINQVQASQKYRQPAQLFWNTGDARTFALADKAGDLTLPIVGRGAASADMDGDGDEDVVLTQIGGPPLVLRNDQSFGHNWLAIQLDQPGGNRKGIGALVEVDMGDRTLRRRIMPTRSYLSQTPAEARFGLGSATIQSVRITWPDGAVQTLDELALNQSHRIKRNTP